MPNKHQEYTRKFDEFEAVTFDEWLQAFLVSVPKGASSISSAIDEVAFSAVNTEETVSLTEIESSLPSTPRTCALEVPLINPFSATNLASLVQSGVTGLRGSEQSLEGIVRALPDLGHPLRLLSLEAYRPEGQSVYAYLEYMRTASRSEAPLEGAIHLTSTSLSSWKSDLHNIEAIAQLIRTSSGVPAVRTLTIPGHAFDTLGSSVVDELAMTVSWLVAYYDALTDMGVSPEELLSQTEITLSTGSDFFLDIAKFRTIRVLLDKVGEAYGTPDVFPKIRAASGMRNKTGYDPDSNILRNTTEALAALLGGANTLSLLPHDFLYPSSGDFGQRMMTHLYNILQHEAHVGKVLDPVAGSYFIEDLTRQLVEKSWELFLNFENQGGFKTLLQQDVIASRCRQHLSDQMKEVHRQRRIAVGATRYTNTLEEVAVAFSKPTARFAEPYETIRQAMDQKASAGQQRPVLRLYIQQDAASTALINQRANYIRDLLTSVGFAWQEIPLLNTQDYSPALESPTYRLGTVFCGTNAFYESTVVSVLKAHPSGNELFWVAGGNAALEEMIRQVGGDGILGIGHDVIAHLEQLIK